MLFGTEIRGDRAAELHGCLLSVVAVAQCVATDYYVGPFITWNPNCQIEKGILAKGYL